MKKVFRVVVKCIIGLFLFGIIAFAIIYAIYNRPLPIGRSGDTANDLTDRMMTAIQFEKYASTRYIEWSFRKNTHHYKWDKELGIVRLKWDNYRILLNLNHPEKSSVFDNTDQIKGTLRTEMIESAVDKFNNDSFWLVAPFKVFDGGTKRSRTTLEDGTEGLLVEYTSGGSTPGDTYLWKINSTGMPESFLMWVNILPIGGLEATWENWETMDSGILLPTKHRLGPMTFTIKNIKAYN